MSSAVFFVQGCPTCGRLLHIRVEYLGKRVACQHCRRQFTALIATSDADEPIDDVMLRAEQLLRETSQPAEPTRVLHPR